MKTFQSKTASRRQFLAASAASVAAATMASRGLIPSAAFADSHGGDAPFKISLAEWSLHRTLRDESKSLTNLDFPRVAKEEFGIEAIEYVNQFFMDKAEDKTYLADLKQRCDDHGVKSLLIMVDREGRIGDPDEAKRKEAVEKHHKWVDAAKFLGCHSIRVNASSAGSYEEQQKLAADGLARLSEYAKPHGLNVLVENHGGLSSNGQWLAGTIEKVGMDNCGTLPDFGNFYIKRGDNPEIYDRYQGVRELMPFAKAVSAKSHDFDSEGNEVNTDYFKMMDIVLEFGYHGYVGIEYEGRELDEFEGIKRTKALLEKVASKVAQPTG
ncbi:sugar phosphate isomerase/epimerase family protein [Crateriforma conspicua]|uniref:Xylose isomerase-like TIM barrel n=1 Tax=Crateriforma conspicua TaxID=2527996 RepID=A0A5C5Y796_9PLAN|nr:sugar phosphate isomerase/epimerase family protein [Crateriforma conspicua]TWT70643.1 Xylose isomerase-like TIM barrel [Crateriforma conspicua]